MMQKRYYAKIQVYFSHSSENVIVRLWTVLYLRKVLSSSAGEPWAWLGLLMPGAGPATGGRALLSCPAFRSPGIRSARPALAGGGSGVGDGGLSMSPRRLPPLRFTASVLAWILQYVLVPYTTHG